MSTPILATKLFFPPPRPKVVHRSRLLERLNQGRHRRLTLLSAPAGFGKTTLVSEWLTGEPAVAWLSLDEGDSDPARFLAYLVAALQTVAPTVGAGVLDLLESPQLPPIESILTTLLNEIAAIPHEFFLVLDDYHVIDAIAIDQALTFLLEHLPPRLHLVITTREDPPLPLARYRARGQLTEVRATDLRFTDSEAADFLNQVMGLQLGAQEIAALEGRTEGWIAGLQLAALSMQGHQDVAGFIQAFAGDHRYIVDYLVEEVLHRQPESVQTFLLRTSILDRLCGPLCDAVTGQTEGRARLELLGRGNFFVIPLDDKRHWYRYHHLFADVLQARLLEEQPEQIAALHRRASEWYEQQGATFDAVHHALAGQDFARVADLLEFAIPALGRGREGPTLLGWLKALPEATINARPVLCVAYGWASMAGGELEAVESWLGKAERWLEAVAETGARPAAMVVANEVEFRHLPGRIATYRAGCAQLLGNVADTLKYARQTLDLTPEDDVLGRGAGIALLGLALWASGDLANASQSYASGMAKVQQAGNISDVISSGNYRAVINFAQGKLGEAMRTYEQSLEYATQQGERYRQATVEHYVGISELHYEYNDLNLALQCLVRSKELSERSPLPYNRARWCVALARVKHAQGEADSALNLVDEAVRVFVRDFIPNARPVAASRARMWVSLGRLGEALDWTRKQKLAVEDDLSYIREFEHITLARVLLAQNQRDREERALLEASGLLARLLEAAHAGGRLGSVIEIQVLRALAHQLQGEMAAARLALQQALTLAEPEGYIRTFIDEGRPLAQLLREVAASSAQPPVLAAYTARLLAAFEAEQSKGADELPRSPVPTPPIPTIPVPTTLVAAATPQPLLEPLSQRELEVLRLFRTELSGPEIAHHLVVALSTIRAHTKSIYSKLNVNSRRAAVNRAEELRLI